MVVVTELIYLIFYSLVLGRKYDITEILLYLGGIKLLNGVMWYIVALVIILVVFYFVFHIRNKSGEYTLPATIAVCAYIVITALRQRAPHEMQSCIGFVLGVCMAEHEETIMVQIHTRCTQLKICIGAMIVFAVSFMMPYIVRYFAEDYDVIRVIFGSLASLSFLWILLLMLTGVKISNRVLTFVGAISTEIYLCHELIIAGLKHFFPNSYSSSGVIISLIVIGISVGSSMLIIKFKKLKTSDLLKLNGKTTN